LQSFGNPHVFAAALAPKERRWRINIEYFKAFGRATFTGVNGLSNMRYLVPVTAGRDLTFCAVL
jgi:hypothetical protein